MQEAAYAAPAGPNKPEPDRTDRSDGGTTFEADDLYQNAGEKSTPHRMCFGDPSVPARYK